MRAYRARASSMMAALFALTACMCGKTTDVRSPPDASTEDADVKEAGPDAALSNDASDDFSLAPSCMPRLPPGYQTPPWVPPLPNTQACDYDQLREEVACEIDDPGRNGVCQQYPIPAPCRACVLTVVGADAGADGGGAAPGAILSDGRYLRLNIGGCVALVSGSPQDYACGAKIHAADACAYDACAHCLDLGVASFGACDVQARLGPCKDQDAQAKDCTKSITQLVDLSPCMPDADFRQSAETLAVVFCSKIPGGGGG